MSNKQSLQLAEENESLAQLLEELNPSLSIGTINVEALINTAKALRQTVAVIKESQSHLVSHRTTRKQQIRIAQDNLIGMRDVVRVVYGADSAEYERAGRTPTSKRSHGPTPKKPAAQ